jgi:hypothetical protein
MKELIDLNTITETRNQSQIQNSDWLQLQDLKQANYSYGFWNLQIKSYNNGQQVIELKGVCKTNIFSILENYGFFKIYREDGSFILIRDVNNILKKVAPAQIKDFALEMVYGMPEEVEISGFKIQKEKFVEVFLREHHVLFGENTLSPLKTHTKKLLSDSKNEMFFPFQNGVAKVTKKGFSLIPYSGLKDLCIWGNHIIKSELNVTNEKSMFEDFINNIAAHDPDRIHSVKAAIGYLLHRYYSSTCTKAVVLYDQKITDRESAHGGTGKGVLVNALAHCRETVFINGKRFDTKERFALQKVNESSQIVFLDDILPDFDFEYFNSILTDGWEVEQKNKTTLRIPFEDSPKLVISSNQIMRTKKGETAERRQFIIEVSDFYSQKLADTQTPLIDVHGVEFFRGWDEDEWSRFYCFMLSCCSFYLQNKLPINKTENVANNRFLQETSQDFIDWLKEKDFLLNTDYPFNENFVEFKSLAFGEQSLFGMGTFSRWLKLFSERSGFHYKSVRYNKITYFKFELVT